MVAYFGTFLLFVFLSKTIHAQLNLLDYYGQYPDYGGSLSPYFRGLGTQQADPSVKRQAFVRNAQSQVGSETYTRSSKYRIGKNKDKCHIFVYDVIIESDAIPPQRLPMFPMRPSPISADQWENSRSMFVRLAGHFKNCPAWANAGDIIACDGHVGVVIGSGRTVMADPDADPNGLISETDFGFRQGQKCTCWRYA